MKIYSQALIRSDITFVNSVNAIIYMNGYMTNKFDEYFSFKLK